MSVLLVSGCVILVLAAWQRKNFGRVMAALGAQFGKLSTWLWSRDPVAVYQAEVDKATEEIRDATSGLEEYKGNIASMERRVAKAEKEEAIVMARIKVAINNGEENRASDYALQLKRIQEELAAAQDSLKLHNEAYQNNLKKIKHARTKIEDRRLRARQLNADLKMSQADAQLAKVAEKFNIKSSSLDGLGEIEEEIHRQIDMNRGSAQVAHDLSSEGLEEIEEQEAVRRAEAKDLLDKIKSDMGKK